MSDLLCCGRHTHKGRTVNVSLWEPAFHHSEKNSREVLPLLHQAHDPAAVSKNVAIKHTQNFIRLVPVSSLQLKKQIISEFSHELEDLLFRRSRVFSLYRQSLNNNRQESRVPF